MYPPMLVGYEFDDKIVTQYIKEHKMLILLLAYNTQCNLACPFCFTRTGKRSTSVLKEQGKPSNPLQYDELVELIDQSIEFGIKSVCFFGEGDPLLDDENISLFFRLVEYVNEKKLIPIVFTNGVMVDKKMASNLFEQNVTVVGKLYSLILSVNECLTGNRNIYKYVPFKSQTVPSHIVSLAQAGFLNSNRFALHTVVTSKNYSEIVKIWQWERDVGIIPYVDFLYTYEDRDLDISYDKIENLCKAIHDLDKSLGYDYGYRVGPHIGHRICNTSIAITIGVNGDVRICPAVFDKFLGDVREKSLKEILAERPEIEKNLNFKCEDKGRCGAFRLKERIKKTMIKN